MTAFEFTALDTPVGVDFYPAEGQAKATILYYHGGGLLYGTRADLPAQYIQMITQSGRHLLCMDYLLAPESALGEIHASVDRGIEWFLRERRRTLGIQCGPYVLFGRSAGAYLALTAAHRKCLSRKDAPAAVASFYGYPSLLHPDFSAPNAAYLAYAPVDPSLPARYRGRPRVSSGPPAERFSLYVGARQQGNWPAAVLPGAGELERFSLSDDALAQLPPTFLSASTADKDVPFSVSKQLGRTIPRASFYPVYYREHDFDRDPRQPEGPEAYRRLLAWLDEVVGGQNEM